MPGERDSFPSCDPPSSLNISNPPQKKGQKEKDWGVSNQIKESTKDFPGSHAIHLGSADHYAGDPSHDKLWPF